MNNTYKINYMTGNGYRDNVGTNKEITWGKFVEALKFPEKQKISYEEMKRLTILKNDLNVEVKKRENAKKIINSYKDKKWVIGAKFTECKRQEKYIQLRKTIAFDLDNCNTDIWEKIKRFNSFEYVLYTTFSHTPEKPKIRIYFLLENEITDKLLYESCVKNFIYKHGLSVESKDNKNGEVDGVSVKWNQLMYLPNVSSGGEYIYRPNHGKCVCIEDYKPKEEITMNNVEVKKTQDTQNKPIGKKEETFFPIDKNEISPNESIKKMLNEVVSPVDMEECSIIKRFCLNFPISITINNWLSRVYIDKRGCRYTYYQASGEHGAIVYPDKHGKPDSFIYSNHSSDPLSDNHIHNSFDLMRIHFFNGDLDKCTKFAQDFFDNQDKEAKEEKRKEAVKKALKRIQTGNQLLDNLSILQNEYSDRPVYKTGFKKLDKYLNGGLRNYLYVLGAGSSMGKTTFIQQLADNIAKQGNHVLYITMEQTNFEMIAKSISRNTYLIDKDLALTASQVMEGTQCCNFNKAIEDLKEYNDRVKYYEADFGTTLSAINSMIEEYINNKNIKPCVIIDYLQVLGHENIKLTDKQITDLNVKQLKYMAKHLKVPIITLSSLNRQNYLLPVNYESFKESGGIEYTADCILGLQYTKVSEFQEGKDKVKNREILNEESKKDNRELTLVSLKNRQGKQHFKIDLKYNSTYNTFKEVELFDTPFKDTSPFKEESVIKKCKDKDKKLKNQIILK